MEATTGFSVVNVVAYHNLDARFGPYQPGHRLFGFGAWGEPWKDGTDAELCDQVFAAMQRIDTDAADAARVPNGLGTLREAMNDQRSLSVGDVIVIARTPTGGDTAEVAYSVDSVGFSSVAVPAVASIVRVTPTG